jgi:putative membrane protein
MISLSQFPALNAGLNATTAVFLSAGLAFILRQKKEAHRWCMTAAFITSSIFLGCYLYYHAYHGATRFPRHDWTRPVYFTVLASHTFLAVVALPLILTTFYRSLKGDFERHKKIARWTWPVWMYVSVTGVLVYFMLYHWFTL